MSPISHSFKNVKNVIYFICKTVFVLEIFPFLFAFFYTSPPLLDKLMEDDF